MIEKEQRIRLRLTDFDRYGHLAPAALLDIFQDLATFHSIDMNVGMDTLREKGLIWVVTRQKIQILAQPKPHQQVIVRTWPHDMSHFSILRDYQLLDEDENVLAKGSSEWVVLDIENKQFASLPEVYTGPTDFCTLRNFEKKLRKLKDFDAEDAQTHTVTPQFTDLDCNMHVNNARYAAFAMNAIEQGPDRAVCALQIDYRKEVLQGQPLTIVSKEDESGVHVRGTSEDGTVSFACLITF